jgi:hypothetical protein
MSPAGAIFNSSAQAVAQSLGLASRSGDWWRCRCPIHGGSRASLALKDGDHGLVIHCHAGCPAEDVRNAIAGMPVGDAPRQLARREPLPSDDERRDVARDIWRTSYPWQVSGQIRNYLATRLILLDPPPSIRLQGKLGQYGKHPKSGLLCPQMIGGVERVGERAIVGVSRTFLLDTGMGKASVDPVRMFCGPITGGAVRLGRWQPGTWLAVTEGIETGLAFMQMTGIVTWAALSAAGVSSLLLPPDVTKVVIGADNDEAGISHAEHAAQRFREEGRRVKIKLPPDGGDWNDREVTARYWEAKGREMIAAEKAHDAAA